jgi:hypothetical protein
MTKLAIAKMNMETITTVDIFAPGSALAMTRTGEGSAIEKSATHSKVLSNAALRVFASSPSNTGGAKIFLILVHTLIDVSPRHYSKQSLKTTVQTEAF